MDVVRGAKTKEMRLRLPTVIGRGGDAKVKLPASTVSRHHCEIYEYEGQIVVRDLGSSNGTIVNGHKIKGPTLLTPDDELTIGPLTARVSPLKETAPEAAIEYPIAPAEEAAPSMEELPPEEAEPIMAELVREAVTDVAGDEVLSNEADDSVLQYAEPKSSGRSFVGIVPAEEGTEPVSDVPVFDDPDATAKPEVSSEDSALNSFFKNLDD